jgi:hypothetical protein
MMAQAGYCRGHLSSVISGAGFSASHPEFFTAGTLGQPTPIGVAQGSGCVLYAGFMPPYTVDYFCDVVDPVASPSLTVTLYPNPFTSSTLIQYSLANEAPVNISVYDVGGRKVRELVSGTKSPGTHSEHWDGRDSMGTPVSSGVYWCVLQVGKSTRTRKMLIIR